MSTRAKSHRTSRASLLSQSVSSTFKSLKLRFRCRGILIWSKSFGWKMTSATCVKQASDLWRTSELEGQNQKTAPSVEYLSVTNVPWTRFNFLSLIARCIEYATAVMHRYKMHHSLTFTRVSFKQRSTQSRVLNSARHSPRQRLST